MTEYIYLKQILISYTVENDCDISFSFVRNALTPPGGFAPW